MYTLYFSPGAANVAPHAALEEIGAPYQLVRVDFAKRDHHAADYLKLNPHARVPTLVDGDFVLYESAAILMHLADKHPSAGLAPVLGTVERARYYQWLCYLTSTVQDAFMQYFHPDYFADAEATRAEVKAISERRVAEMWQRVDEALTPGPYLLGSTFSGADLFLAMLVRWSRLCAKPGYTYPAIGRCVELVRRRPAFERMMQAEGITWPTTV